jgi:hypothetical protein
MKGDFSRMTWDPAKRYTRVLMQQGRVLLDSDWNEMVEINVEETRAFIVSAIGPHAGMGGAFKLAPVNNEDGAVKPFEMSCAAGNYFVGGIRCELAQDLLYSQAEGAVEPLEESKNYLAYLEVCERHVTSYEDEDKQERSVGFLEVALRGPDTTTRTQTSLRVRALPLDALPDPPDVWKTNYAGFLQRLEAAQRLRRTTVELAARASIPPGTDTLCAIPPESKYRGVENQLYRVEVQKAGALDEATLKWSRDNGSVIFPIDSIKETKVKLRSLGRDASRSLKKGDTVEVSDDVSAASGRTDNLFEVVDVDPESFTVTLSAAVPADLARDPLRHPLLRRWDSGGEISLPAFNAGVSEWLDLEDGVQIRLRLPDGATAKLETGDYWLIPARTATGDVEWPGTRSNPAFVQPHGQHFFYAPLGVVATDGDGKVTITTDLRRVIKQAWE